MRERKAIPHPSGGTGGETPSTKLPARLSTQRDTRSHAVAVAAPAVTVPAAAATAAPVAAVCVPLGGDEGGVVLVVIWFICLSFLRPFSCSLLLINFLLLLSWRLLSPHDRLSFVAFSCFFPLFNLI